MIDRFGRTIYVGWAPHEIEWVKAAMTLDGKERQAAFRDIADMTGRSINAIHSQVYILRRSEAAASRRIMVPERSVIRGPRLLPSALTPPSKERLMAGRA